MGRAASGGDDQIAGIVFAIDEWGGAGLARAPPYGRQQQCGHAVPDVPILTIGFTIAADVVRYPVGLSAFGHG